jgi:hypothetical protein
MPDFIRAQVPFYTTHRGAIDTTTLSLLMAVNEVAFSNLHDRFKEMHCLSTFRTMLAYYSLARTLKYMTRERQGGPLSVYMLAH